MNPGEYGLPVIDIIGTLTHIEVDDADGVDLFHLIVTARDCLGRAVEDTLQIMEFAAQLNLDDDDVTAAVLGLDVHTVELVVLRFLVSLTLQNLYNLDRLIKQNRHKSLKYGKVGLVAEQAFHGPVKANISVVYFHITAIFVQIYAFILNPQRNILFFTILASRLLCVLAI